MNITMTMSMGQTHSMNLKIQDKLRDLAIVIL